MPQGVILCTASYDKTIRLWEPTTNVCSHTITFQDPQVNVLCISHNKNFLAAAANNHIRIYQLATNDQPRGRGMKSSRTQQPQQQQQQLPLFANLEGHTANILALGFQQDDKWMYSGGEDGTVRVWDLRSFTCQREYSVCGSSKQQQRKKKSSKGIRASNNHVNSVVLHPNQVELIAGDQKGYLRIWDLTADKCTYKICVCKGTPIRSVDVSQDGRTIAVANQKGNVYIYHYKCYDETENNIWESYGFSLERNIMTMSNKPIPPSKSLSDFSTAVPGTPTVGSQLYQGDLTSSSSSGTLPIFNTPRHISSSDQTCFITEDGAIRLINQFNAHFNHYILKCKIAPNCTQLATCSSDSTVRLWDLTNQCRLQKTLSGHKRWVWDCTYNSDSSYLVTASSDLTAKLWDCAKGEYIKEYKGHAKAVVCCALHDTPVM